MSITLNETESKIRELLVEFSRHYDQVHDKTQDPMILRITGGWVRDKLLNLQSDDLDIAINNLTGLEFAQALNNYISDNAQRLGLEPKSIHKIEKNPEKSKHLETATTKLYGLDVDFVNLRSEEYAEDSRIPQMKFGTAAEDAYRRDATLNALFYNLQEQKVEDFTGQGIDDLKNGVLRTPLAPFDTFNEDPLRVLRLIRFSAKFGFEIAPEAAQAMQNEQIKVALIKKISRERVGVEIGKTLAAAHAYKGLCHISNYGLEDSIFHLFQQNLSKQPIPHSEFQQSIDQMKLVLDKSTELPDVLQTVFADSKLRLLAWLSACLSRWSHYNAVEKKKDVPAVFLIVRDALKLPLNDGKIVAKTLTSADSVASALNAEFTRKEAIKLIRECGEHWPLTFVYALSRDIELLPRLVTYTQKLYQENLQDAWMAKAVVSGKDIIQAFGVKKPGPWLAKAVEYGIERQLEYPDAKKEELLDHLVNQKHEFVDQS